MLSVSAAYKNAVSAPSRRIKAKVRISYSDPFLDPSVETIVNEKAYICWENQVVTISIDQETEESAMAFKYASLDGTWVLDGTWHLAPDTEAAAKLYQFGWWGTQLAGGDGYFVEPYPALTANFSARSVVLLAVQGDSKRSEWPVDFKILMYDSADTLLETVAIEDNTEIAWQQDIAPVEGVVKMVLQIEKWSHPGRQVKIAGFFSVLIENYTDEILGIEVVEEREFSTGKLPIGNISANEITVRLSNEDHRFDAGNTDSQLHNLVKANRKIKAWLGVELPDTTIEYIPIGVFYAQDWTVPENSIEATVTGTDRLDLLALDTFSAGVLQDVTIYDLAVAVLNDAGITNRYIDPELQDFVIPYAYFNDDVSHRECLRIISEASLSQVYADRVGVIRIEGPSYLETNSPEPVAGVTRDDYFSKDNPNNYNDLANYIVVKTMPLLPAESTEVYKTKDDNPETIAADETKTLTIYYSKKPVIDASVSLVDAPVGASITNVNYYAWGADVAVTSPTEGTFKLTATAKPLEVQGSQTIVAQDAASIREHGKKIYTFKDNPLIQTPEMAQMIAEKCLALSKDSRRDLDLNWRGDPALQLGDRITVPDSKTTTADFYVVSQSLNFDGGLRVTTKGKKVIA